MRGSWIPSPEEGGSGTLIPASVEWISHRLCASVSHPRSGAFTAPTSQVAVRMRQGSSPMSLAQERSDCNSSPSSLTSRDRRRGWGDRQKTHLVNFCSLEVDSGTNIGMVLLCLKQMFSQTDVLSNKTTRDFPSVWTAVRRAHRPAGAVSSPHGLSTGLRAQCWRPWGHSRHRAQSCESFVSFKRSGGC